uniref:Uncharacterized protein n=1 Tax=Odontella aurita TaxID=265563 RepID=A0A7S4K2M8_9STRA|mmetsp:Transcript_59335/g.176244  ORF Transcript_59335/g.176244 Transcript_59335/m.176244 type:complete len:153 (+) Transcript_59335:225-683(+)
MFTFFVFRRYGVLVPVLLLLVGYLVETLADKQFGAGYYSNHLWAIGLDLLITGTIVGVVAYIVGDHSLNTEGNCCLPTYLPLDMDDDKDSPLLNSDLTTRGSNFLERCSSCLQTFIEEPSEKDHFCFVPMNWCALAMSALGLMFVTVGAFTK